MKKKIASIGAVMVLLMTLTGCESDPKCWFADDAIGCLVITNNQNS